MGYSTEQIIQARCNSLYLSPSLPIYIDMASQQIDATVFGTKYALALALLSCHLYTVDNNINSVGGVGSIASKSEGDSSISFHNSATLSLDSLNSSGFGQEFLNLRKGTVGRFANTGYNSGITYPIDLI